MMLRPAMAAMRVAIEACTPATMSSGGAPEASRPMISVSAKTTHMLLMAAGVLLRRGQFAQLCQLDSQARGHDLQEAPGAGGTAVVHGEVAHRAVGVQSQQLAVLPADLDDGARLGHGGDARRGRGR